MLLRGITLYAVMNGLKIMFKMGTENSSIEQMRTTVESPATQPAEGSSSDTEKMDVKRGRIGQFKLYEVAEYELLLIEKGSDASVWLNFGISGVSIFFSILAALLTLDTSASPNAYVVFVVTTVCSFIASIVCIVVWCRTKGTGDNIIKNNKSTN